MNVSLTPKLEEFIRHKVDSGLYNNASEVIREALRGQIQREAAMAPQRTVEAPNLSQVQVLLESLEQPLREKGVISLALFGSLVRGEAKAGIDIDVLVEIDAKKRFSLIDLVSLKHFLEDRLHHEVDVVTRDGLEPCFRDEVFREAVKVF